MIGVVRLYWEFITGFNELDPRLHAWNSRFVDWSYWIFYTPKNKLQYQLAIYDVVNNSKIIPLSFDTLQKAKNKAQKFNYRTQT